MLLSVGHLSCLVVRPSHRCRRCRRRHHPWDICPVEASSPSSSLSSGPHHLSPTLLSLSAGHLPCKGLIAVVVWWGVTSSVPHHCHRCRCHRLRATCPAKALSLSLSGGGYVVCPPPLSSLLSLATPHIVVVVVVHGPFVLQRLRHCHRPVGASLSVPCVIVVSRPPHRHCCCCCCWGSSSAPHIIAVRGSFVLWRPRPRCCLVGASSSLPHIVIVIHGPFVLWRPHCRCCPFGATLSIPHHCHHCCCLVGASSSLPHIVVVVIRGSFVLRR